MGPRGVRMRVQWRNGNAVAAVRSVRFCDTYFLHQLILSGVHYGRQKREGRLGLK